MIALAPFLRDADDLSSIEAQVHQAALLLELAGMRAPAFQSPCAITPYIKTRVSFGTPTAEDVQWAHTVVAFASSAPNRPTAATFLASLPPLSRRLFVADAGVWGGSHVHSSLQNARFMLPTLVQVAATLSFVTQDLGFTRIVLVTEREKLYLREELVRAVSFGRAFNITHTITAELPRSRIEDAIIE